MCHYRPRGGAAKYEPGSLGSRCSRLSVLHGSDLLAESLDGAHDLLVTCSVGRWPLLDEGDGAGGLEDAGLDFLERVDSLFMGGGDQLGFCNQLALQMFPAH